MKLYTRKDIENSVRKSKWTVRYFLTENKIEPIKITYGVCNNPIFHYTEEIYLRAVYYINKEPLKYRRQVIIDAISKEIFCDLDLNVIIPSKLNYLTLQEL